MASNSIELGGFLTRWYLSAPAGMSDPSASLCAENPEEIEDIRQAANGDEDAFAKLLQRYQPQVFRYMWRFTQDRNTQEDLVQEVFVETYKSLRRFRGDASLGYWIHRIATNVGYRFWRRMRKDRRVRESALARMRIATASDLPSPERMDADAKSALLFALMEELPPRERLVLTLRYFECLSNEEIAKRTGWNSTLVRVTAYRARKRMRSLWEDRGLRETGDERYR